MSRKWILSAIGGGETAGPEVEAFGRLVAHVGAILMTGMKSFDVVGNADSKSGQKRANTGVIP